MSRYNVRRFTEKQFWSHFLADVKNAKSRVVISSPYVSRKRLLILQEILQELTARGVLVCAIIQLPNKWKQRTIATLSEKQRKDFKELEELLNMLESFGVHYVLRRDVHQKIAIIDDTIVWEGSLNILSNNRTKEQMLRQCSRTAAKWMQRNHDLHPCKACLRKPAPGPTPDIPDSRKSVGMMIARGRAAAKMTQAQLASEVGMRQSDVSEIEHGKRHLSLAELTKLTAVLPMKVSLRSRDDRIAGSLPGGKDAKQFSVPAQLAMYRRAHNMTQAKLAKRAAVSRSIISEIETGTRDVSLTHLLRLLCAMNLTLDFAAMRADERR